jgi:YVTN family beta-propeller protein
MPALSERPLTSAVVLATLVAMTLLAATQASLAATIVPDGRPAQLGSIPPAYLPDLVRHPADAATSAGVPVAAAVSARLGTLPDSTRLNCQSPADPLYDSGANEVFVNCEGSNNVTVISPTSNTVIASIPVGNTLSVSSVEMAYDPVRGEVFVANKNNTNGNTVSVISDKTNTLVATVTVGQNPSGLAYDSEKGEVFVLNANSNDLSVISDTTNAVVATIPVGSGPNDVVYDSGVGELFVPIWNSDTVSVVSDSSNSVVATIPVGIAPAHAIYDPAMGEVLVLNEGSNTVSIISDTTNSVHVTVPVGSAGFFQDGMAYDSGKREVFVSNFGSANVSVISDVTDSLVATVPTGPDPQGMTYVPAQNEVFLESIVGLNASTGRNISVISDSTNSIVASIPEPGTTYGAAYDPGLNELFVPTFPDRVNVISTLNDTVVDTIEVGIVPPTYSITFAETGLPPGSTWQAGFTECETCSSYHWGTSTSSTNEFSGEPNGTSDYLVWTTTPGFSPTVPFGSVTVHGANVTVEVSFVPAYQATFIEKNLNDTTAWSVIIQGSVTLSNGSLENSFVETHNSSYGSPLVVFQLPNGTFTYRAGANGYSTITGRMTVNGGPPPETYLSFSKSSGGWGLTTWTVVLGTTFAVVVAVALSIVWLRRRSRERERRSSEVYPPKPLQ